jgi:hypothetical protein
LVVAFVVAVLAGCGGGGSQRVNAHNTGVQRAVESKIKETINLKALGEGTSVQYLTAQCIPESDSKLSCIVSGLVEGQSMSATWEGIVDPETGRFNVHSTG